MSQENCPLRRRFLQAAALVSVIMILSACDQERADAGSGSPKISAGDPEQVWITEAVKGSDIPVHLTYVETLDGLYAPIGIRKPSGDGPFPMVLFASGNGGGGMAWIREATQNRSWSQERFVKAGYAVAWLRYRAEVELGYHNGGKLVQDVRQGRQLLSRGPLEYEDEIAIIEYVKTLPFVDGERIGIVGLSHGGEMVLKILSEYQGVAAAISNEPAAHEFLALRPPEESTFVDKKTEMRNLEAMQLREVENVRKRVDLQIAMSRIATINTPILVMGRDHDHLQGIFRITYELLQEAGKDVEWVTYDHPEHGYIYPYRGKDGKYRIDAVQEEALQTAIDYLDRYLKK